MKTLYPGEPGYDDARKVWNAMADRRPAAIARCRTTADVAEAVRYARAHDLEIGVRGGGHSMLGLAVPEGGLMIDLSAMNAVRVDPGARRARVGGGALLGGLDRAAQVYGLATPAGNVSHTGVGGLTLGGGTGWLSRLHGLTCDNVESYEMVTADGEVCRADAYRNPDLFWALRGGGGNFGVVTEFVFRLHPVGTQALEARVWLDPDRAPAALRAWRGLLPGAARPATYVARSGPRPSLGLIWIGDPDQGRRLIPELEHAGGATAEVTDLSYVALQSQYDDEDRHGLRRYCKSLYFGELPDAALEAFLNSGGVGGRLTGFGGAVRDVPDEDTPFAHRDAVADFSTAADWTDPADDETVIGATRRYAGSLEPYAIGTYVNTISDQVAAGIKRAYPPATMAKLAAIKERWDPANVFHLNVNIRPSLTPQGAVS